MPNSVKINITIQFPCVQILLSTLLLQTSKLRSQYFFFVPGSFQSSLVNVFAKLLRQPLLFTKKAAVFVLFANVDNWDVLTSKTFFFASWFRPSNSSILMKKCSYFFIWNTKCFLLNIKKTLRSFAWKHLLWIDF